MCRLVNDFFIWKHTARSNNDLKTDEEQKTGPKTKIMRMAKMSFQSGQVKQVIRAYAVEIQTDSKKDLELDTVTLKLRKAMGANCKSIALPTHRGHCGHRG